VARGDVADLVAHHAGELGLAVEVGHDPARHVHVAAGQRERVDLGRVEHREGPLQVGAVRLLREPLAEVVDVRLQARVGVGAVFLEHLLVRLGALGDLGLLVHHRALGLAGDGIDDLRPHAASSVAARSSG
jgi:hypothetical protein